VNIAYANTSRLVPTIIVESIKAIPKIILFIEDILARSVL
jgi:hypothetical protein